MDYNNKQMNKLTKLTELAHFYWLFQLYQMIVDSKELPIRNIFMLSSRESGKTHVIEDICSLLLCQVQKVIVINFIRSRNLDVKKEQKTIKGHLDEYTGGEGVFSNLGDMTITMCLNKMNFVTLNEEKEKVQKNGGKIGLPIERQADYIITIFEECSQIDMQLQENLRHSIRGNANTQMLFVYMSNPWILDNWFVQKFLMHLPETKEMEEELYDRGYNMTFDHYTKSLYFRPRHTLNPYIKQDKVNEIAALKDINYNKWKIVSLGFSGNLRGSIYAASLAKLQTSQKHITHNFYGGIDWGDGKSAQASASVAYLIGISLAGGIDVYGEYEWWNNKGVVLSTEEQMRRLCKFYIDWYEILKEPIQVYLDNAAVGDFYITFQQVLTRMGYGILQIEFLPAFKPKNTWERVETVNALMCLGVLRFNKDTCKGLYKAMENCYEVASPNPTETMKRKRSHEWTHWLNALEYGIGIFIKEFQDYIPYFDNKSNGEYAIY